jgi:CubicO group peptidase (beta-lactamase class C family)
VAVLTDVGAAGGLGSVGQVWWAGSDNTYFWIDPEEEMIGLLMVQVRPFGHLDLMNRFSVLAQQAIVD